MAFEANYAPNHTPLYVLTYGLLHSRLKGNPKDDTSDFKWKHLLNGEEEAQHDWNRTVINGAIAVWKLEFPRLA